MNIVLAHDAGKNFRWGVSEEAIAATGEFLATLCPVDKVRVAMFGTKLTWLSDSIAMSDPAAAQAVLKSFTKRPPADDKNSINDLLVKTAIAEWEKLPPEDTSLRVLAVFTDTLASDAPIRMRELDWAWDAVPSYLRGRMLVIVSLLDQRARDPLTIFVTDAPEGIELQRFPSGGRTDYTAIMRTFIPPPPPPPPIESVRVITVDERPSWLRWVATPIGAAATGGAALTLLLSLFLIGRMTGARQPSLAAPSPEAPARPVTLRLWDRLARTVVREETRSLLGPLRISPATDADFIVPGPYAAELIAQPTGVAIRTANVIGIEIRRKRGRAETVALGETATVQSGDCLDLGGGHEVEIRFGEK